MSPFCLLAGRACRDDRGSVAIIFALSITAIFGCVALAVDLGRGFSASTKLARSLDAAALAGAKLLGDDYASDSDIVDRVNVFVAAQPAIFGIASANFATLDVVINRAASSVTVNGAGKLPTSFASIIGVKSMDIAKTSTVVYKMRSVELALALDVTGSMNQTPAGDTKTKIESLKSVAQTVVDTLYGRAINDTGIRIAMAPFSSAVNAGSYASLVATGASSSAPCVVERLGSANTTDASPYGTDQLRALASVGGGTCPTDPIMPLTGRSKQKDIDKTIANFSGGGSTAGHIGAAWGMYLLSPNWSGIFTGAQKPGPYNDPSVSKNFVLMTDGLFNTSYLSGASVNSATAISDSYAQLDGICSRMKQNGITIYTIGFGLNDPTASAKLSQCASVPTNFFPVANGSQLQSAFDMIVAKLNQLRVSN
jgi:Flp pilus assembly protein TadG